jgi:P4 family phage/plasmid primase-like protien
MKTRRNSIDYITGRLTIGAVCRAIGITEPQPGRNIRCPLGNHEDKTPSFTMDDKKGKVLYHCKSCQQGGDALDLIMRARGLNKNDGDDFKEGLKIAADVAGISQEELEDDRPSVPKKDKIQKQQKENCHQLFERITTVNESVIANVRKTYLGRKKIDLSNLDITYIESGDFVLPMYDQHARVCGYQSGKKMVLKGSRLGCFVGKLDPSKDVYVVEGVSDYLTMLSIGVKNVIGLCSSTTPTKDFNGVLHHFYYEKGGRGNIKICLDYDGVTDDGMRKPSDQGFSGARKALSIADAHNRHSQVYFASTKENIDINDLYFKEGADAVRRVFMMKEDIVDTKQAILTGDKKANPAIISKNIYEKEILASENGNLWKYTDGVWRKMMKNEPEKMIKDYIRDYMHVMPKTDVISQSRDLLMYDSSIRGRGLLQALESSEEYYERNHGVVFFEDCKYNFLTDDKMVYTPDDYVFSTLAGNADFHGATAPLFMETISDTFAGDYDKEHRIDFMQELFGYCMYPQVPFEKLFVWVGKGGNGKGTLMETLAHMIGTKNRANMEISRLDTNSFALSQLIGIYVNSCSEERKGVPLSSPTLKMLTGGDTVSTDRKFSTDLKFKPICKIIISLNDAPSVTEDADWLARRLMSLSFNNNFDQWLKGKRGNPNLKRDLRKELPGIRAWSIKGLNRLITNGKFTEPASMKAETISFLERNDRILQFFERKLLPQINRNVSIPLKDLYSQYKIYHEQHAASMRGMYNFETFVQRMSIVSEGVGFVDFSRNTLSLDHENIMKKFGQRTPALSDSGFVF